MRVVGVEIRDHPGIGDVDLDFRDATGEPARLVVLAGENGCGKTVVLDTIALALGLADRINVLPSLFSWRATVLVEPGPLSGTFGGREDVAAAQKIREKWPGFDGLAVQLDPTLVNIGRGRQILHMPTSTQSVSSDNERTFLGGSSASFFLQAHTNFDVPAIYASRGAAGGTEHVQERDVFQSGGGLASQITQLLIDLRIADELDNARWYRANPGQVPPPALTDRRIGMFSEAFDRLFDGKRFADVETVNTELIPLFEQFGKRTPLSKLSTGEKQVVFRGAFLLRSSDLLTNAVVLLDEPELSLHPRWQAKVLAYYDAIVEEPLGARNQIITATLSPYVVHGSPTAKHIVLRRNRQTGAVELDDTPAFQGVTSGEVAIAAFELADINFGRQEATLALVTEGKTDAQILEAAWDKLRPGQPRPFALVPAGGAKTIVNLIGTSPVDPGWLINTLQPRGIDRYLCLYDFDDSGFGQWKGLVMPNTAEIEQLDEAVGVYRKRRGALIWSVMLPRPPHRSTYASLAMEADSALAIEALFEDQYLHTRIDLVAQAGGGYVYRGGSERQKRAFAALVHSFPAQAFAPFAPIFALVDAIVAHPA